MSQKDLEKIEEVCTGHEDPLFVWRLKKKLDSGKYDPKKYGSDL